MLVKYHLIFGFVLSIIILLSFPNINYFGLGIIFLSSILIDFDHYLYYAIKEKTINPFRAVKYFLNAREKRLKMSLKERKKYYAGWCFLHGIEILVLLFIFGIFLSKYFLFILIGFSFHLFLDLLEQIYLGGRIDKISVIWDFIKYRKLELMDEEHTNIFKAS